MLTRWSGRVVLVVGLATASAGMAAEPVKLTDASFLDVDAQLKAAEVPNPGWKEPCAGFPMT